MSVMSELHQQFIEGLTIEDIRDWADGVVGALGTEYAARVTPVEAQLARVILAALPPEQ